MGALGRCGTKLFNPDKVVSVDLDVPCQTPAGTISTVVVRLENSSPLQFVGEDADMLRRLYSTVYSFADYFRPKGGGEPTADPNSGGDDKPVKYREFF